MLKRTAGVIVATLLTALLVYGAVQSFAASESGRSLAAAADYSAQVCPATGCYATTCHATQGGGMGGPGRGGYPDSFSGELQ